MYFLAQVGQTTPEQRKEFIKKYCEDVKRFEETTMLILEQADHFKKTELIGKIYKACILERINFDEAIKLSNMVNRVYWTDLEQFLGNTNIRIDENNQSLLTAGLFAIDQRGSLGGGRLGSGVRYEITVYGKKLIELTKEQGVEK
jgi:hypothetical protein